MLLSKRRVLRASRSGPAKINKMEEPGKQKNNVPDPEILRLIIEKVKHLLAKHDIHYLEHMEVQNGVRFKIELPEEHIREIAEFTRKNLLNTGGKTIFLENQLMPFVRQFTGEYGEYLDLKFLPQNSPAQRFKEFEILITNLIE